MNTSLDFVVDDLTLAYHKFCILQAEVLTEWGTLFIRIVNQILLNHDFRSLDANDASSWFKLIPLLIYLTEML